VGFAHKTTARALEQIMKSHSLFAVTILSLLPIFPRPISAESISFIYETPREFFGSGDFDGDGRADVVIVDKDTGKYRLGYQATPGQFLWVDCRPTGIKGIAGFGIGGLFATNHDSFAFTAPDANQVVLADASSPTAPGKPMTLPFSAALGPSTVVPVDIGGAGNTALLDLYVGSIYNSPDPNLATLLRNDGAEFPKLGEATLPGPASHGNRLSLKAGQPELLWELITEDKGDSLRVENLASG
jgi:hypothetical protein